MIERRTVRLEVPYSVKPAEHLCGPTVLSLVARYHGLDKPPEHFADIAKTTVREGTCKAAMFDTARKEDLWAFAHGNASIECIHTFLLQNLPVIIYTYYENALEYGHGEYDKYHYEIVTGYENGYFLVHDVDPPEHGGGPDRLVSVEQLLTVWKQWILVLSPVKIDDRFKCPLK